MRVCFTFSCMAGQERGRHDQKSYDQAENMCVVRGTCHGVSEI
jgi:hypothetical protein